MLRVDCIPPVLTVRVLWSQNWNVWALSMWVIYIFANNIYISQCIFPS